MQEDNSQQPRPCGALGDAIRQELLLLLRNIEYVDFDVLSTISQLAYHGRLLVSVRNPMTRFDARAMEDHAGPLPPAGGYGYAAQAGYDEEPEYNQCFVPGQGSSWAKGPMARQAEEMHAKALKEILVASPLARALRVDLLDILESETFTPTKLLEVEQLASRGLQVLEARFGISRPVPQKRSYLGINGAFPQNSSWAPSSSSETFGAAAIRSIGSLTDAARVGEKVDLVKAIAAAKEAGLDDVAADLRAQLSPELVTNDKKEVG